MITTAASSIQATPVISVVTAQPDESAPSAGLLPSRKLFVGGMSSIIAWVIIVIADSYGLSIPMAIQQAIPIVLGFGIAYLIPSTAREVALKLNDRIVKLAASMPDSMVNENTAVLASHVDGGGSSDNELKAKL